MSYKDKQDRVRSLEQQYTQLMKKSFETAAKDRESSNAINDKALQIKEEIDTLKSTEDSF